MKKITLIPILCILLVFTVGYVKRGEIIQKEGSFWTAGETASSQRRFKIQMKTYNDPAVDYSKLKKFRLEFRATEGLNPLLDKHLNSLVKDSLVENGLMENAENPDFIVVGSHKNIFVPDRDAGIRTESGGFSGSAGGQHFSGTYHSGDNIVTALVKLKRAQRYWVHNFGLVFLDADTREAIWTGTATAWVRVDDIRETAPDVIKFLIGLYPEPSFEVEPSDDAEEKKGGPKHPKSPESKEEVKPPEFQEEKELREINYPDDSKYVGDTLNGKRHGQGTYIWPSGQKYVGEWENNSATGGWFYRTSGQKVWAYQDSEGKWIVEEQ